MSNFLWRNILFTSAVMLLGKSCFSQNFDGGLAVATGYIHFVDIGTSQLENDHFKAFMPAEFGIWGSYAIFDKANIKSAIFYAAYPIELKYRDKDDHDPNVNSGWSEIIENRTIQSFKLPMNIEYFILRNTYVSIGIGLQWSFAGELKNKWDYHLIYGLAHQFNKFTIELALNDWPKDNRMYVPDHFFTYMIKDWGYDYRQRYLKLTLYYQLWQK